MRDSIRFSPVVLAVALAAVVSACSDNGDAGDNAGEDLGDTTDPDTTAMQSRLGVIRLATRSPAVMHAASAVFVELDDADTSSSVTLETMRAQLLPDPGTCVLQSELLDALATGVSGLDAGEVLTLTDANGTYIGVERMNESGTEFTYRQWGGAGEPPAGELLLDIPGGDAAGQAFPASAATPFPTVARAPMLLPPLARARAVTVDSVFRWGAPLAEGGDERPFLLLVINSEDVITNLMLCALPEDEEFTLPDATIAALQARNEVQPDGSIGAVFGFGAMRIGERQVDDQTRLLMRMMRFTELPRS